MKVTRVQIEIVAIIFEWLFKQQENLPLLVSDWFCKKVRVAGFSEPRRETDVRYEFDFKVIFKNLGC